MEFSVGVGLEAPSINTIVDQVKVNGSETKIYLDGEYQQTVTENNTITADLTYFIFPLGDIYVDNTYYYSKVLSLEEVQQLYAETV